MDSDIMGVASAYSGMRQAQVATKVQTQVLSNALDDQAQALQELMSAGMAGPALNPPYLGQNLDIKV